MNSIETDSSTDFTVVNDVLEGIDLSNEQRLRIGNRTTELLDLDRSIVALRSALEISQMDVAEAMGVSSSSVSQLESRPLGNIKIGTLSRYLTSLGYRLKLSVTRTTDELAAKA
ncbi:MAG: XRE family transcriptional regulator [Actinobacteria bacterium]|jgi:DNA-directed RNA polymerase specialized sigma subunit|nr:XRE family transcriptional regulator [Actinomycetota bacterium]MBT3686841.1 XRE family transcriptional regulator [Actinomycetota bacterium]MBT4037873.1 XRE family transcriptional regulator [Actinomycetota bacterium]MBT4279639.1 XRE family transcriptional regulator [Actinomycetota bacterium]MBT4343042.1 XRE family transcriptional regulator [Actinomycetota bacterium]